MPEEWRGFGHGAMSAHELARTDGLAVMELDLHDLAVATSGEELRLPTADPDTLAAHTHPDGPTWICFFFLGHHRRSQKATSSYRPQHHGLRQRFARTDGVGREPTSTRSPGRSRISAAPPSLPQVSAAACTSSFSRPSTPRPRRAGWLGTNRRCWAPRSRSSGPTWTQPARPHASPSFPPCDSVASGAHPSPPRSTMRCGRCSTCLWWANWGLTEFPNATSAAPTRAPPARS